MTQLEPASRTSIVIDPDPSELATLRADAACWLAAHGHHDAVLERAVLATSELAHMAMEHSDPAHPVVVDLRQTHSILVIEVLFHLHGDRPVADLQGLVAAPDLLDLRLLEHVVDRVSADAGGRRVTLSSTIHLSPSPDSAQGA
jgi:hypothetical protein